MYTGNKKNNNIKNGQKSTENTKKETIIKIKIAHKKAHITCG